MQFHTDGILPINVPNTIFVFGSNLAGHHTHGTAKLASKKFGAEFGVGKGRTGMSYAIPIKDNYLRNLQLESIKLHVTNFLIYARAHPELAFFVTRIGCKLKMYEDHDIAPMFAKAPTNCSFAEIWFHWIEYK
jgi:hypothetical protein